MRKTFLLMGFTFLLLFCCVHKKHSIDVEAILRKNNIYHITNDKDYFISTIKACNLDYLFHNNTENPIVYYIYENNKLKCVVEKIPVTNEACIEKIYNVLSKYASNRRNLKRKDFGNICFDPYNLQFYYVIKDNYNIFLIGSGNENFEFSNGNESVENIIHKKKYMFYDIFLKLSAER